MDGVPVGSARSAYADVQARQTAKAEKNMNNQNQKPLSDDELKEVLEEIRR
jgi:hypothetical protein